MDHRQQPPATAPDALARSRAAAGGRHRLLALGRLLRLDPGADPGALAIHRQQLREIARSAPTGITLNALTALGMAAALRHSVGSARLAAWCVMMLLINLVRGLGIGRIRRRLAAGTAQLRAKREISALVVLVALGWLVPVFLWSPIMADRDRFLLSLAIMGIMIGSVASLGAVPSAALAMILILWAGQLRMTLFEQGWLAIALTLPIFVALLWAALRSARLVLRDIMARRELDEQGQLIGLLREFQSSGSDWLWELDGALTITYLSRGIAESVGRPVDRLIGRNVAALVDPDGEHRLLAEGIRSLFDHFEQGTPFHELALPAADGSRWYSLSGRPVIDAAGRIGGWRGIASDISDLRSGPGTEGVRLARRDPLTGLANRMMVREMLEEARLRELRGDGACVLLLLDLDRFKMVNDTLGHAVGDRLLVEVARRLERVCADGGGIGRLGGDEFAVVWRGPADSLTLLDLSARVAEAIDQPFLIGSSALNIGVSIGIARATTDGHTQDQLMRSADLALYRSKEQGRSCSNFYEPWMLAKAQADRLLESDVREAVRRGDLDLHYQPIVDARSFAVIGHEALLRWSHPRRGAIGPDVFVPIIEDVGLIHQIGDWVIREACAQAARWPGDRHVAVNISVAQLIGANLTKTVEQALRLSGLAPGRLELEVTESIFLGDDMATLGALADLHALGVRLVLDDFGKGYSSFGYLSRACFAKIKIDQLFVRGAASGRRECLAIVKSILALASGLGVETTAEGVETAAQAELLAHLGCTQLQGYLFGKPVPPLNIDHGLARSQPDDQPVRRIA